MNKEEVRRQVQELRPKKQHGGWGKEVDVAFAHRARSTRTLGEYEQERKESQQRKEAAMGFTGRSLSLQPQTTTPCVSELAGMKCTMGKGKGSLEALATEFNQQTP